MNPAIAPLNLVLVALCLAVVPLVPPLKAAAGVELLGFWGYALWRGRVGFRRELAARNLLNLFPGHVVLLLGLGFVGAWRGLLAWLSIPVLSISFDLAANGGPRSIAAFLYAILWSAVFFAIHQLVAKGKIGPGPVAWGAALGSLAALYVVLGLYRIMRKAG